MSSQSDHSDIAGDTATQTTESSDTAPVRTDGLDHGRSRRDESGDAHHVSAQRARINTLQAEVALLEAERGALADQVTVLESEVAELEDEVASLEGTIESTEEQRQQLISRYEHIIEEKEQAYENLRQEIDATPTESGLGPRPELVQHIKTVIARVKRFSRNW